MEKKKLTIKELAPYLPYRLKICYRILDLENGNPNTDNPDDRMKDCIMIMDGARLDRCLLPETDRWYSKDCLFKPILRPLSDLENGNYLRDLFELAYHSVYGHPSELVTSRIVEGYNQYGFVAQEENWDYGFSVDFDGQKDFRLSVCSKGMSAPTFLILDKLELFTKLFEWYFDVFNLIESGLAIDINKI